MDDTELAKAYRDFVKSINHEWPPDEEEVALDACSALTETYGLDRYHAPPNNKTSKRTATAACEGGVFLSSEGGVPSCRG